MALSDEEVAKIVGVMAPAIQEYVDAQIAELAQQVNSYMADMQAWVVSRVAGSEELAGFVRQFWLDGIEAHLNRLTEDHEPQPAEQVEQEVKPKPKPKGGA